MFSVSFFCKGCFIVLIGNFASLHPSGAGLFGTFPGTITNICCTQLLVDQDTFPAEGKGRIFEVHLELLKWDQVIVDPLWGPVTILIPAKAISGSYSKTFVYDNVIGLGGPGAGRWQLSIYNTTAPAPISELAAEMWSSESEYIHVGQGDCNVGINLTNKNKTKQNYLHCIEDGTKKINFS